jgi:hypothetical protein
MPEEIVPTPAQAQPTAAPAAVDVQPEAPPEPAAVAVGSGDTVIAYGNVVRDNKLGEGKHVKRDGAFDSEVAKAAKKLANQRIAAAAAPAVDLARTRVSPKLHAAADAMRRAGWKKVGIGVGLVCLGLLLLSLLGVGR